MIELLITLIVVLLIAGLVWWAGTTILGAVHLPQPIHTVVYVLLVVIVCLIVIYGLMGLVPMGRLGWK